jgi:ATP-dependent Clp protease protease subunit
MERRAAQKGRSMRIRHHNFFVYVSIAVLSFGWSAPVIAAGETNSPFPELKKEQERLTLENGVAEQRLRQELAKASAEKERLELANALEKEKLHAEVAAMQAEIDKLTRQADLVNKRAAVKEAERRAALNEELMAGRESLERMRLSNELAGTAITATLRDLGQREMELKVRTADLQAQRSEFELQTARLNNDLDLRVKRDLWKNRVNHEIEYSKQPFKDGVLTISDRRIALNGVITMDTADYIAARIDYFNNQSHDYPIFLVIDRSPGGSVMAGYKILKAMEGSVAPVYTVVKSFAASMAANIATQSKKSFAYPNAIILHHQILSSSFGNLTEQKEQIKEMEEWWKRLAAPVAVKMGISREEFIKQMYQNRSTGDWLEFGDGARKLKWVDEIVETVREESFDKSFDGSSAPGTPPPVLASGQPALEERLDVNGRRYVVLPRLDPVDCYYLHTPYKYYRLKP